MTSHPPRQPRDSVRTRWSNAWTQGSMESILQKESQRYATLCYASSCPGCLSFFDFAVVLIAHLFSGSCSWLLWLHCVSSMRLSSVQTWALWWRLCSRFWSLLPRLPNLDADFMTSRICLPLISCSQPVVLFFPWTRRIYILLESWCMLKDSCGNGTCTIGFLGPFCTEKIVRRESFSGTGKLPMGLGKLLMELDPFSSRFTALCKHPPSEKGYIS